MIGQHVHMVGIGGIGMSALARHLLSRGIAVSGSDRQPGEQGEALRALGATVYSGHEASHIAGADLVVITSAVAADNPEIIAAKSAGIPVMKRAELLAEIANPAFGIAVAGTHGKTTTSALIAHILTEAGRDPTVLIGGISKNLGSNARVGGEITVIEADEYDASFLRLRPRLAVITNVEPDHLDFYGSAENVHKAFRQFAGQVRDTLVVCADDVGACDAARASTARVMTYGLRPSDVQAESLAPAPNRTSFTVKSTHGDQAYTIPLAGLHNVRNALAAIAVAGRLDVPPAQIAAALTSFQGVGRRLEVIGEASNIQVVDSYGHHPTEIRHDLAALGQSGRPIRLIFQPHTYSRTKSFLKDFATSFERAESVYLLDIYAARETDTLGISGSDLAAEAALHHPRVAYTASMGATLRRVLDDVRPGDLVVTMGAGDVNRLGPQVLERLRA
ncbi:MAG TPA: UDP-N-acetylmuramate--L-alanine ligase [Chloroflexota bacterium]|nr:UDP-N-acetylmuramate--L-alanine ligase [Chloroflexota bacterium]